MSQLLALETSATAKEEFDLHLATYKKNLPKDAAYGGFGGGGAFGSSAGLIGRYVVSVNVKTPSVGMELVGSSGVDVVY